MIVKLKAPSKTFLIGEYLALGGGPSLVINTEPRFTMEVHSEGEGLCQGIHPQSPAGQWVRQDSLKYQNQNAEFSDPHEGKGGLGASTAQFLMAYVYSAFKNSSLEYIYTQEFVRKMWHEYRQLAWLGEGPLPSGADLIGQYCGGIAEVHTQPYTLQKHSWPFSNISFVIVRTGHKVATHEHLKTLDARIYLDLKEVGVHTVAHFRSGQWKAFSQSLNEYYGLLCEKNLVCEGSRNLVKKFIGWSEVLAAKACGALGADTVIAFCESANKQTLLDKLQSESIEILATEADISSGLGLTVEGEKEKSAQTSESEETGG